MSARTLLGAGCALAGAAALAGSGGAAARSLVGHEWSKLPTQQRVVALTFDCGGDDAGVRPILRALAARHAAATFFLTGRWAEAYPAQARRIAAAYPVGDHTYSHPDLTRLPSAAVQTEITRGARVIRSITGTGTKPLLRFPYGARDERTLALAAGLGYGSIGWTVDTLGWKGRSGGGVAAIVSRVLAGLQPGEIVLMHVGAAGDASTPDADALPALLRAIAARGYGFTTLADYTSVYERVVDDAAPGRFAASSHWRHSSWGAHHYGAGYHYAEPAATGDPARFRLPVPRTGRYLVYARWPAARNHNRAARFGVRTTRRVRWTHVDQRRDGGRWVYLGSYPLRRGDRYLVRISRRTGAPGLLVADAVRLVRRQ